LKTALQNSGKFKQIQIEKRGTESQQGRARVWCKVRKLAKEDNPCYSTGKV